MSRHCRPYFGQQPLSPHPVLLCTAPLIHNGMSHGLKHLLSWVHFCVKRSAFRLFSVWGSLFPFTSFLPTHWAYDCGYQFCLGTIVKSPFETDSHYRVFSMGLCTTEACVEAVRRAPALIRHKWRKQKNHSAFAAPLSSGNDSCVCVLVFTSVLLVSLWL